HVAVSAGEPCIGLTPPPPQSGDGSDKLNKTHGWSMHVAVQASPCTASVSNDVPEDDNVEHKIDRTEPSLAGNRVHPFKNDHSSTPPRSFLAADRIAAVISSWVRPSSSFQVGIFPPQDSPSRATSASSRAA